MFLLPRILPMRAQLRQKRRRPQFFFHKAHEMATQLAASIPNQKLNLFWSRYGMSPKISLSFSSQVWSIENRPFSHPWACLNFQLWANLYVGPLSLPQAQKKFGLVFVLINPLSSGAFCLVSEFELLAQKTLSTSSSSFLKLEKVVWNLAKSNFQAVNLCSIGTTTATPS